VRDRSRLDAELVRRGLARSRGHAQELIATGRVSLAGDPALKPSAAVLPSEALEVSGEGRVWASRAAYKLLAAMEVFGPQGLGARGKRCLDVGASTGGFTEVLLEQGAAHVTALDVGHGQLVGRLSQDPRVSDLPGTNVRDVRVERIGGRVELLVADVSFISLTLLMGRFAALLAPDGEAVVLVKPQFEVGRERLGKGGIVRDPADRAGAVLDVAGAALLAGLPPRGLAPSPITGGQGNAEYLLWLGTGAAGAMEWQALVSTARHLASEGGT
jgi:23S rRNA (cytidine1920-2'-O)/16S rRNA (cytidine1409-2'-O)-methyltransferase